MLRIIPPLARKRKLTAGGRVRGKSGHCLSLGLLEFADEGGEDLEEIADDSVVCYFEDGRVLVVNCGDGVGAVHAHDVLNGAADSVRKSCGRQL